MNASATNLNCDQAWSNQNFTRLRSLTPQEMLGEAAGTSDNSTGNTPFSDEGKVC